MPIYGGIVVVVIPSFQNCNAFFLFGIYLIIKVLDILIGGLFMKIAFSGLGRMGIGLSRRLKEKDMKFWF